MSGFEIFWKTVYYLSFPVAFVVGGAMFMAVHLKWILRNIKDRNKSVSDLADILGALETLQWAFRELRITYFVAGWLNPEVESVRRCLNDSKEAA